MKLKIAVPRLLPITMLAMGALLAVKSVALVRAAIPPGAAQAVADAPKPIDAEAGPASKHAPEAVVANAKADAPPPSHLRAAEASPPKAPDPPISESERSLLLDLRKRSVELDAREAALGARGSVLAAAETRLTRRLDELGSLQKRLESLEAGRRDHDEANWRGLVKLYESMKARDAAVIFNELDMAVLLPVVDRMKETKAAGVLAAMQPERARQVTAELAQMRSRAIAVPAAASDPPPAKNAGGG